MKFFTSFFYLSLYYFISVKIIWQMKNGRMHNTAMTFLVIAGILLLMIYAQGIVIPPDDRCFSGNVAGASGLQNRTT